MSYTTAVFVVLIPLVAVVMVALRRQISGSTMWTAFAKVLVPPAATLVVLLAATQIVTGRWYATFLVQRDLGGLLNRQAGFTESKNVFVNFGNLVVAPGQSTFTQRYLQPIQLEMWFVLLLVVVACVAAFVARRQSLLAEVDVGLAVFAIVTYVVPVIVGAHITQVRQHALLVPAMLLLRHLRGRFLWPLAIASLFLSFEMGRLFFESVLV